MKTSTLVLVFTTMTIAIVLSDVANAGLLTASSYDLRNGELGGDVPNFFDDSYTGIGNKNTPLAQLTGGLGDLTDGKVATQSWRSQHLAYVGWHTIDPTISFHFLNSVALDNVKFYFDDAEFGGVDNPSGVTISNGIASAFKSISDPPGNAPFVFNFSNPGITGKDIDITLHRQFISGGLKWVMVSEIEFTGSSDAAAVPEPSSIVLISTGLLLATTIAGLRRGRQNQKPVLSI